MPPSLKCCEYPWDVPVPADVAWEAVCPRAFVAVFPPPTFLFPPISLPPPPGLVVVVGPLVFIVPPWGYLGGDIIFLNLFWADRPFFNNKQFNII